MQQRRITEHSADLRNRFWVRKQLVRLVGLGLLVVFVYDGLHGSYSLLIAMAALTVSLVVPITVVAFVGSRSHGGAGGFFWRGRVAFAEDDFDNRALFTMITRTNLGGIGREGLTGGILQVTEAGLHWRAGSLLTPRGQLTGAFALPWEKVKSIDISNAPMRLRFLGGAMTVYLEGDEEELHGEFLGSRRQLLEGLRRSPLGP